MWPGVCIDVAFSLPALKMEPSMSAKSGGGRALGASSGKPKSRHCSATLSLHYIQAGYLGTSNTQWNLTREINRLGAVQPQGHYPVLPLTRVQPKSDQNGHVLLIYMKPKITGFTNGSRCKGWLQLDLPLQEPVI